MGHLTLTDIREEIVLNLGNRREYSIDDPTTAQFTSLTRAVNLAQRAIKRKHPNQWKDLRITDRVIVDIDGTVSGGDYVYAVEPTNHDKWLGMMFQQTDISLDTVNNQARGIGASVTRLAGLGLGITEGTWLLATQNDGSILSALITAVSENTPAVSTLLTHTNDLYTQPADLGDPVRLLDNQQPAYKMTQLPRYTFDMLIGETRSHEPRDRIVFYTIDTDGEREGRIQLYPVPRTIYTLFRRYSVWPTDLTAETDTIDYENLDDVIIANVTAYCFRRLQMYEEESHWNATYIGLLNDAIEDDEKEPDIQFIHLGIGVSSVVSLSSVNPWQDPFVQETL